MNLALPAMMMIVILLVLIIRSRIPAPVIMMSVPVGFALICGYGMSDTLDRIMAQFHSVMGNMGYMLLFSLIYFQMLTESGSSMAEALAAWLIGTVPGSMMRYAAVLFLLALVLLVRLAPYQISAAMYPMLVSIGTEFGISAVAIVAPLVTCIGLGTGVSPMTASTYVSAALAEVEMDELGRRGVGIMCVSLFGVVIVAALWGILPLG